MTEPAARVPSDEYITRGDLDQFKKSIDPIQLRLDAEVRKSELTQELAAHGVVVSEKKSPLKSLTMYPLVMLIADGGSNLLTAWQAGDMQGVIYGAAELLMAIGAMYGRVRKGDLKW